jgi:hypothetical protein
MAASTTSSASPGRRTRSPARPYGGATACSPLYAKLAKHLRRRPGLRDQRATPDQDALAETPSNPLLRIDLAAASKIGKAHKAIVVVDNTFASFYPGRPSLGADVMHSTTKYLNGH